LQWVTGYQVYTNATFAVSATLGNIGTNFYNASQIVTFSTPLFSQTLTAWASNRNYSYTTGSFNLGSTVSNPTLTVTAYNAIGTTSTGTTTLNTTLVVDAASSNLALSLQNQTGNPYRATTGSTSVYNNQSIGIELPIILGAFQYPSVKPSYVPNLGSGTRYVTYVWTVGENSTDPNGFPYGTLGFYFAGANNSFTIDDNANLAINGVAVSLRFSVIVPSFNPDATANFYDNIFDSSQSIDHSITLVDGATNSGTFLQVNTAGGGNFCSPIPNGSSVRYQLPSIIAPVDHYSVILQFGITPSHNFTFTGISLG